MISSNTGHTFFSLELNCFHFYFVSWVHINRGQQTLQIQKTPWILITTDIYQETEVLTDSDVKFLCLNVHKG